MGSLPRELGYGGGSLGGSLGAGAGHGHALGGGQCGDARMASPPSLGALTDNTLASVRPDVLSAAQHGAAGLLFAGAPLTMPQQRHLGLPRNDSLGSSTAAAQAAAQAPSPPFSLGGVDGARLRLQAPSPGLSLGSLGGAFPDLPPGCPPGSAAAAAAALDGFLCGLPGELGPGELPLCGKVGGGDTMDFDAAMLRELFS